MQPEPQRRPDVPDGYRVVDAGSVASSNDVAKQMAVDGAVDGTVVWAREQTAGRGRQGRAWSSPEGNLYLSFILRPACGPTEGLQLGFVGSLAVRDALCRFVPPGAEVAVKWPNDILVDGSKIVGMLLESSMRGGKPDLEWLVLGVGVNVASHPEDTPFPATDLAAATGTPPPVVEVLESVVAQVARWRQTWQSDGFAPVRAAWLRCAHRLNEEIEVRQEGRESLKGVFAGLDETGALLLDTAGGGRATVRLGDVFPPVG